MDGGLGAPSVSRHSFDRKLNAQTMTDLTISILAQDENAEPIRAALEGVDHSEVDAHSMTGLEGGIAWLITAVLASPVLVKLLDILQDAATAEKIDKVSVKKNGKVVVEGASAKEAAKLIQKLKDDQD